MWIKGTESIESKMRINRSKGRSDQQLLHPAVIRNLLTLKFNFNELQRVNSVRFNRKAMIQWIYQKQNKAKGSVLVDETN